MGLFQKIRSLCGIGLTQVEDQPIDILDKLTEKAISLDAQLQKAQEDYDRFSSDFELKIAACDKLIEKGNPESEFNKKVIVEKLEKATNEFLEQVQPITKELNEIKEKESKLSAEILAKSIEIVSLLPEAEQKQVGDTIATWQATGLIKGQEVNSQLKAIVTAIDLIIKADISDDGEAAFDFDAEIEKASDEKKKKVKKVMDEWKSGKLKSSSGEKVTDQKQAIAIAMSEAGLSKGDEDNLEVVAKEHIELIKAESFEGHYANVIVRNGDKILFLKRSKKAKVAPGKWCLPGGHIDEGETIYQAAERELKEESNLDCKANNLYIRGKAKCEDGKWCFYLDSYGYSGDVALLDGEMENAAWMTKDEWLDADLFFDLKDHLISMDFPEFDIDKVPTLSKAEKDLPETFFFEQVLEKAWNGHRVGTEGEIREYKGKKYQKKGKIWKYMGAPHDKKLPVSEVVAHAENTSSGQLKKISILHQSQHIRDAAKRELERRKVDKEKKNSDPANVKTVTQEAVKSADKKKKKPEPVKYNPNPDLSSEHKEVEKRFGKHLNKNYNKVLSQYEDKFGHVLSSDSARELSEDYEKNRAELSAAVHEPASNFIKGIYAKMLLERVPKGKRNLVYFTAGGTGAGKTSGLQGQEKSYHDKAHIVYDTNMNTMAGSIQKIDQALNAGKKVRINYTFRDPIEAFSEGAVPRALRIGRTVPIESHIETHLGSMSTILGLKDKYKGNKNVQIVVTDNSKGKGKATKAPLSFVKEQEKKYTASDLREKIHGINNKLYERGKISESHYKGFRG